MSIPRGCCLLVKGKDYAIVNDADVDEWAEREFKSATDKQVESYLKAQAKAAEKAEVEVESDEVDPSEAPDDEGEE